MGKTIIFLRQAKAGGRGSITYANNADVTVENCHNYGDIISLSQDDGGYAGGIDGKGNATTGKG